MYILSFLSLISVSIETIVGETAARIRSSSFTVCMSFLWTLPCTQENVTSMVASMKTEVPLYLPIFFEHGLKITSNMFFLNLTYINPV